MGGRDFRHRETKKPKKDAKKLPQATTVVPLTSTEVEVVGKRKKKKEEEPEESQQ